MGRQLVAYYSRRGRNFVGGEIRDLAVGNTEIAAGMVQVLTQADLFRIEPSREYSPDYCRCIDQARQDLLHGVRLELKAWPENWEAYDTVYLGYPNHWNTLPVAVFSFVEGRARPSAPSASTRAAAWAAVRPTCKKPAPAPISPPVCRSGARTSGESWPRWRTGWRRKQNVRPQRSGAAPSRRRTG